MHNGDKKRPLKMLFVDLIMGSIFVFLVMIAVWLVWIYYFRGPIEIVTSPAEAASEQELLIQAREEYSRHFHNLDNVVLGGIQTSSLCVECHGDYPHSKTEKLRSMLNAHSWFIVCEVCHLRMEDGEEVAYRWFDDATGEELTELEGGPGKHGAMIVPVQYGGWGTRRLDEPADEEFTREYIRTKDQLNDDERKTAEDRIHETMLDEAVECDGCHKHKGLLKYGELLFPPHRVMHLESLDMGAMAKTYEEFYFPEVFERQTR